MWGSNVTKTSLNLHLAPRRRGGILAGAPVAFVLGLLLAACQGAGPPDVHALDQNSDTVMRVADETAAAGDPGTAAGLYRRAAALSPDDPRPLAKLGAVLLQLRAYTEAAATYRAALKMTPNPIEPELHRGLAVVLLALDQPQGALAELDAAVAKSPQDPRLYNTLGVAHDLTGRHDLAQQDYRNGLRLAPDDAGLRNNYALSLALSRDYPTAVATLRELAERTDASPRHRLNLALIYGLAGDDKKAAELARTTLDEVAVANNLAYYALLRSMDDKARADAIMGRHSRGPALTEAAPKSQLAAAPAAVPTTPVSAAPLPPAETPPPATAHRGEPPVATAAAPAPATVSMAPAPWTSPASAAAAAAEPATTEVAKAEAAPAAPAAAPEPVAPAPSAASARTPVAPPTQTAAAEAAAAGAVPGEAASTEVAEAGPAALPPPAQPAAEAEPATAAPEAQPTDAAAPAAAAEPPAAGERQDFVLQLGSFSVEPHARRLAEQLNQKGYEAVVLHRRDRDGRDWFVVRAGAYASAGAAAAAARRIRDAEQVPAVVVHVHAAGQA